MIEPSGAYVLIRFGEGRSSHTWRDFKWLLSVLKPFFKKPCSYRFKLRDEYDGFAKVFPCVVDFHEGKIRE